MTGPGLAMALAWPFIFLLPGLVLAARVAPDLSPVGRVGLGVVTSVFASAHVINGLATLAGAFGRAEVLAGLAVLIAGTAVLLFAPIPGLIPPPRPTRPGRGATLHQDRSAWWIAAGATGIVGGILWLSAWHLTRDGWVSGGWNWSDLLVHVAIAASILHGNFPPQVPYFAGEPLTYHWFADFHAAIAASLANIDVIPVMVVTNALMAGALALLIWELARVLAGDRRVAALASVLGLFGGGMGYLRLPFDLAAGQGNPFALVSQHSYDNAWLTGWPYFRIASVFGTGLLAHRATALGLPALVAVVLLVHLSLGRRPAGMVVAGLLAAGLAPFHFYAFPAVYLIVLLQAIVRRAWLAPTWRRDAALFLLPALLALPFLAGPALQQRARGALRPVLGWPDAPLRDGLLAVAFFYATNLGIPFLLAIIAALHRQLPNRGLLTSWFVALFLLPNFLVVSAVTFDMNKYFQIQWIALAIMAAWLVRRWATPLLALVLAGSLLSPALVGIWHLTSETVALTVAQEHAARWIEHNTPERSVFITDAFINSPVDLAGRLRVTTFGPYVANLGYDPSLREADVHAVYCEGDRRAAAILSRYGARYVLSSGGVVDCRGGPPTRFQTSPLFETVYDDTPVTVWRLRSPAP